MKITLQWLKDYLETDASVEDIAERLTLLGLVVEGVHNPGESLKNFRIVHIEDAKPHPNADRLRVCTVNTGNETLQVVCGAPNAHAGMKGVLARPGMTIPATGQTLKLSKIRDIESQGMLCSLSELNLASESDGGIIELPAEAPIGESYVRYAGLDDSVLDVELTPNRGDCAGAYGLARDLAATGIGEIKIPSIKNVAGKFESPLPICLESDAKNLCPFFAGRYIRGVKNGPSPEWLQKRLRAVGIRPISALVDITNYMAYDLGRPMHVFDAQKIQGEIIIRKASEAETLLALDDKEYALDSSMLTIADRQGPLSLGGIMGGKDSGCSEDTTDVFLESALFDPINIAYTGRKLGIISDARYRFERGVDPALILPAIEKATAFILEHCGGEASAVITAGQLPESNRTIDFKVERIATLAGLDLDQQRVLTILSRLGFGVMQESQNTEGCIKVTIPTWRNDVETDVDLVEEVVRVEGYGAIPSVALPPLETRVSSTHTETARTYQAHMHATRRALAIRGLMEATTMSFLREEVAKLFGGENPALKLLNPLTTDFSTMRPSLLPNLIDAVQRNAARGQMNAALFEVGPQFHNVTSEGQVLAACGVRSDQTGERHWLEAPRRVDIFDVKADAFSVLEACGISPDSVQIVASAPSWYHPKRSGVLQRGPKNILGYFGELHPGILQSLDVKGPIVGFEIFLSALPMPRKQKKPELHLSAYQPVTRDFAFIVDRNIDAERLVQAARKADRALIEAIGIFDVYEGEKVLEGKKSIGLWVKLQPQDATLTEAQINAVSEKIIGEITKATGGELRS